MEIPVFAKIIGGVGVLGLVIYLYSYFMEKGGDKFDAHQEDQEAAEKEIKRVTSKQGELVEKIGEAEERQQESIKRTKDIVKEIEEDMKKPATSMSDFQRQIEADWGDL